MTGSILLTIVAVLLIGAGGLVVLTATGIIGLVLLIEEDLAAWPRPSVQQAGRARRLPRA